MAMVLRDMVFQGTVLGPKLWNIFFKDVDRACPESISRKFADDLTMSKTYPPTTLNETIRDDLRSTQTQAHTWGALHRVTFDETKEHFAILHHVHGEGEPFRLLGPILDCKLTMKEAVDDIAKRARPKLYALLRSRQYYGTAELVLQFKSHILPILECGTAAIYHASDTILKQLDGIQAHFFRDLGLSENEAFTRFNLAPLCFRRDVAMLGLLHKCTLGIAHESLRTILPAAPFQHQRSHQTRLASGRHNKQLLERCFDKHLDMLKRSVFGLTRIYNLLPQFVVDAETLKSFQARLTKAAHLQCENDRNWTCMYSQRIPSYLNN